MKKLDTIKACCIKHDTHTGCEYFDKDKNACSRPGCSFIYGCSAKRRQHDHK